MKLNNTNYFSPEAQMEYFGASQLKSFIQCENKAMAEISGEYKRPFSKALAMGSYVDAWFSDEMDEFIDLHPELFKKDGSLRADYVKCDQIIERAQKDSLFMGYMSGEKQKIMIGELFGYPFKIKMDSYHEGQMIVDLKVMASMLPVYSDGEWKTFIDAWGYDIQAYIYQQVVKYNTGKELPFYFAVLTKEDPTDLEVIHLPQWKINAAEAIVKHYIKEFDDVKRGARPPKKCGKCDWCRQTKVLTAPIEYDDLLVG